VLGLTKPDAAAEPIPITDQAAIARPAAARR
jgi:hypothetical protein